MGGQPPLDIGHGGCTVWCVTTLYTVGHSTRSMEEMLSLLWAYGVARLVDVRRYPGSRRFPHFAREALADHLARAGVDYVHEPALGGRRKPSTDSPNTWWRNAQFRAYADHLATDEFQEALQRVMEDGRRSPTAIMCAEAVHWRCHRQLIADVLVSRGHAVLHIQTQSRAVPHVLTAHARVQGDHLVYPADDQLDLL